MQCSPDINDSDDNDDEAYMEVSNGQAMEDTEHSATYRCLFCKFDSANSADELIQGHVPQIHGVRLAEFMAKFGFREQRDWVQLVAFLRSSGHGGAEPAAEPAALLGDFATRWRGEQQGRIDAGDQWPTVCDDPLMYEVDLEELLATASTAAAAAAAAGAGALVTASTTDSSTSGEKDSRIRQLEDQVALLKGQLAGMSTLLRRLAGEAAVESATDSDDAPPLPRAVAELSELDDDYYVESYSGHGIHAEMLLDKVRTGAYHSFISGNPHLFSDRLILDVGCGSGILSMFAARSGARVLAVDCAAVIEEAKAAAHDNGLADRIKFCRGKLESLSEVKGANADAIVSEWMGYFLLYEGMIESVMYARDHCLRPGGSVYPRICSLHLCGLDAPDFHHRRVAYFDDVYGVRLTYLRDRGLREAHVTFDLRPEWVATDSALLRQFDLLTAQPADTRFATRIRLTASRDCSLDALAGYFDVSFLGEGDNVSPEVGDVTRATRNVTFSTGPPPRAATASAVEAEEKGEDDEWMTHWGQTVFCLRQPLKLTRGQTVELGVTVGQPEGHPRGLTVGIELPDGSQCSYSMK